MLWQTLTIRERWTSFGLTGRCSLGILMGLRTSSAHSQIGNQYACSKPLNIALIMTRERQILSLRASNKVKSVHTAKDPTQKKWMNQSHNMWSKIEIGTTRQIGTELCSQSWGIRTPQWLILRPTRSFHSKNNLISPFTSMLTSVSQERIYTWSSTVNSNRPRKASLRW